MLKDRLFRTAVACRVVGLDRDRFNEAVAAGNYPCAPSTNFGQPRILQEHDLIGLEAYKRFSDMGFNLKAAGYIACELVSHIRQHPDAAAFVIAWGRYGNIHVFEAGDYEARKGQGFAGLSPIVNVMYHDVSVVRQRLADAVKHEDRFVGGNDPSHD